MTITATAARRATSRVLKSPLAVPDGSVTPAVEADALTPVLEAAVLSDRGATLAEFEDYLRTVNNRDGRPYEEKTISNYTGPGKNLDAWMTANGIDGDFTALVWAITLFPQGF
jgi:integrase/recombinase XerD